MLSRAEPRPNRSQGGMMLIEVLVALVLCAFGLMGYVAMQARATTASFESLQRSQALVLLQDMAARMSANRMSAGAYVTTGLIGGGSTEDCSSTTGPTRDLCEWGNLLRGSAETTGGGKLGAMISARGCIQRITGTSERYMVSVAWMGNVRSGAPGGTCGQGDSAFPDEPLRRSVSTTLCVARLRDLVTPNAVVRC